MLDMEVLFPFNVNGSPFLKRMTTGRLRGVWEWELWPSLHDAATFTSSLALMPYSWRS